MIVRLEDLAGIRQNHKNEKIVLTGGTFDILHVGHKRYLEAVKALGDVVVVMMSGDARTRARKGPKRPIIPENDRAEMLDALRLVDYVLIDPATAPPDEIDPVHAEIVDVLQPDVYATDGPDPRFWDIMDGSKLYVITQERSEGYPNVSGRENASTSSIIKHILETERSA
jgi:rfaE bifunctional protein nucleotidyltransferase chain/domain